MHVPRLSSGLVPIWETRPVECVSKGKAVYVRSFPMTRARRSRSGAMISLLGCLLLSTPVLAQTGGGGGSVNGGAAPAVGPAGFPIIPGTVANAAPTNRSGTYGGMGG